MIDASIKEYDIRQEGRHRENSQKLDRNARETMALKDTIDEKFESIQVSLNEANGVKKVASWGLPLLVSVLMLVAEIIRLFGGHG